MFEPVDYDLGAMNGALIKVVGIGGGGGNAVNHMVANMIKHDMGGTIVGADEVPFPTADDEHGKIVFYAVNTDAQALRKSNVQQTVQIGGATTKGLGAGANPNVGRKAAEDEQLLSGLFPAVSQDSVRNVSLFQISHVHKGHPPCVKAEQEHVTCEIKVGFQGQVQSFDTPDII